MELVSDRAIRAQLKKNTKMAIEAGVFGLPAFIVRERNLDEKGELFWGNDSTAYLEQFLKGDDLFAENSTHPKSTEYKEKLKVFQSRYQTL